MRWKDIITQVKYQEFNVLINHQNVHKFCKIKKKRNGNSETIHKQFPVR